MLFVSFVVQSNCTVFVAGAAAESGHDRRCRVCQEVHRAIAPAGMGGPEMEHVALATVLIFISSAASPFLFVTGRGRQEGAAISSSPFRFAYNVRQRREKP